MQIIEQFLKSKTSEEGQCEDAIFINDHFAAVIDGATSKSGKRWDGKTSGKIATELLMARLATMGADAGRKEFMERLDSSISDWYRLQGIYEEMRDAPMERCTASLVVYSKSREQLWFLGDCQAIIDIERHSFPKPIDAVTSNARAMFLEAALLEGKTVAELQTHDIGRDFILPLLQKQNLFQNRREPTQFGYYVLDGFFQESSATCICIDAENATEIVLASDGYPCLKKTLQESERALQKILEKDPLLIRQYKSTKGLGAGNCSYDDRAYLRFRPSCIA